MSGGGTAWITARAGHLLHSTAFGLLLAALTACSPPLTVEQQVIAVIRDMEARIEATERRPFMAHVASDFTAQDGRVNREQFNALVLTYLHRYKQIRAQLLPIQVAPQENGLATARFRVVLTGGAGLLPQAGQIYQVETSWRREDDEWLLVGAEWLEVAAEKALQ